MSQPIKRYLSLLLLLNIGSCIEKVNLDTIADADATLVIEGSISNAPGPYQIRVSYSSLSISNINTFSISRPVNVARVVIKDAEENEIVATNAGDGLYETSPDFRGEVGETYTLEVTVDDQVYESTPQTILPPVAFDELKYRYNEDKRAMEILIDFDDPDQETNYYRWNWTGFREFLTIIPDASPKRCCEFCYLDIRSNEIFVLEDRLIDGQRVIDFQAATVKVTRPVQYLVFLEQQNISREAYRYFNLLEIQNQSQGQLFDPPPFRIEGNMEQASTGEKALGIFYAFGSSTSSIQYDTFSAITDFSVFPDDFSVYEDYECDCRDIPNADTLTPIGWTN